MNSPVDKPVEDEISNKSEILIVDDSATMLATSTKMLEDQYIIQTASNGAEAWEAIQNNIAISMVFTDMQMPVMNGMELLLKIRESKDSRISRLPVIIITGEMDTPAGKQAAFDIGATDFIGKPFNALDLRTRARAHIGDRTRSKRRASDLIKEDALEMLLSPSGFHSVGSQAVMFAYEKKIGFSVVYVELVNFSEIRKVVNEKNAKQIIISLAMRIKGATRDEDVATRIGENRFAILIYTERMTAKAAVERLSKYMNNLAFEFNGEKLKTELAYGYANSDCYNREQTFSELCAQADQALKDAIADKTSTPETLEPEKEKSGRKEVIDIWSALKYVADGQYHLIPDSFTDELVGCMNKYLEYVEKRK